MATKGWFKFFLGSYEKHLVTTMSDHLPLLFQIRDHVQDKRNVKRSFKFENMWTRDDSCSQVVEESWKQSRIGNFKNLADTVARCGVNLTKWNKVHYCNLQNLIKKK